jgi:hypothetical protein
MLSPEHVLSSAAAAAAAAGVFWLSALVSSWLLH